MTQSQRAWAVTAGLLAAVGLAAAGCGSSSPASGQSAAGGGAASHHSMHSMHSHSRAMAHTAVFGSGCAMVPESGMGSLHGMSMEPVAVAAAHNPLLSTFAADVKMAGLTGELDSMHALTVFAPADSAFRKLPASQMSMMRSAAELAKILKYQVVSGRVTPAELAHGMTLKTLAGGSLRTSRMGGVYEVNNADVVCGNIQTANATVYIINKVLEPVR
jgi:uncharacterized surface protein with fasciclin (FAS1) repeats